MKILMAFFLLSGFCFKSPGIVYKMDKARGPGKKTMQSFNVKNNSYEDKQKWFLDNPLDLPWGVCFPKGKHNFTQNQLRWTKKAMGVWNERYFDYRTCYKRDYLKRVFEKLPKSVSRRVDLDHYSVEGWPNSILLQWSCKGSISNLVYPRIGPTGDNVLAYHRPLNPKFVTSRFLGIIPYRWSEKFYGEIVMSDKEDWKREHFINVMMHELGHLLGIPHLEPKETNIMASQGFGCRRGGKAEICDLTHKDFSAFLSLYPSKGDLVHDSYYLNRKGDPELYMEMKKGGWWDSWDEDLSLEMDALDKELCKF